MKRTPLARKSPLKAKSPMKRKSRRKQSAKQKEARWRSPKYLAWVRTLPCCVCNATGGVAAHHLTGMYNASGMGLKAPDSLAMPACDPHNGGWNNCHARIHAEKALRDQQPVWIAQTLARAMQEFEGDVLENLKQTMLFIDSK